jgi:Protein of unknown function (DUF2796)
MSESLSRRAGWRAWAAVAGSLGAAGLIAFSGPATAAKPHEHGIAQIDIAVEAGRVRVMLDMPLEVLLGFERAPRDDAERQRADAAVAQLRNAASLFTPDPAARCTVGPVELKAPVLGLGPAAAPAPKSDHADLEASFEFICQDGFKAGFVEVGLFQAFPRLQRIDVQAVTRKGQMKATLRRPASRVTLAR